MRSLRHEIAERLDPLLEREIRRLRARYELSLDEFRGLYVSDQQVDHLVSTPDIPGPIWPVPLDCPAAGLRSEFPAWGGLVDRFALSPLQEDLLFLALAADLDSRYETLYAYLNNDVTQKWLTGDLASRILRGVATTESVLGALAPGGQLRRCHLVREIVQQPPRSGLLHMGMAIHSAVSLCLQGQSPWLGVPQAGIAWTPWSDLRAVEGVAQQQAARLLPLLERASGGGIETPVVAVLGEPGSGRSTIARALAMALRRPLIRVCLGRLGQEQCEETLREVGLALHLEESVVLVEEIGRTHDEGYHAGAGPRASLAATVSGWPAGSVVLLRAGDADAWRECTGARRVVQLRCGMSEFEERVDVWRVATGREGLAFADRELHHLAGGFRLTAGQVRRAVATAQDLAAMSERGASPGAAELAKAARLTSDQSLGKLAARIESKHQWSDLILPAPTLQRLRDFAAAVQDRGVVFERWGFGTRVTAAAGLRAVFAGSSGTGKSMAAGIIARFLELDLYRIDLSGVVSKYIGETEKNLDKIFAAARGANAIIFLDEAEAILGKRSEVKDAHDRYANIEVAYLLQKLEDHDGVVILATNLKHNMDDAFSRRMQFVIDFPRPDASERERIWRGMFPDRAPVASDVDFKFLAKQFDLAGGDICNVVLDAAFLAAQDGGVIGMPVLVEAVSRQLLKQGKTPTGSEFKQYQSMTSATRHLVGSRGT